MRNDYSWTNLSDDVSNVPVTLPVIPMTVTLIVLNCDAKNDVSIPDSGYEREDYYS
jgi:hypothetical protein